MFLTPFPGPVLVESSQSLPRIGYPTIGHCGRKLCGTLDCEPYSIQPSSFLTVWRFVIGQPYATKAIFQTPNPPVKLSKIAIGDGVAGSFPMTQDVPVVSVIETYPQIVSYDTDVLNYFREQ